MDVHAGLLGEGVMFLPSSKSSSLKKQELERLTSNREKKKKLLEREFLELLLPLAESFHV